jgi:uncharacterized protein YdhG (YjbR/CyaY superfamily)
MAKKGPMPDYHTSEDYISNQPENVQMVLRELREIILEAAPDANEVLNYKVPSFVLVPNGKRDQQIMMAGYAKFVGFYPFPTTMEKFSDELKGFKQGKGSVQFPLNKPLPKDLIIRMVRYRRTELMKELKK